MSYEFFVSNWAIRASDSTN